MVEVGVGTGVVNPEPARHPQVHDQFRRGRPGLAAVGGIVEGEVEQEIFATAASCDERPADGIAGGCELVGPMGPGVDDVRTQQLRFELTADCFHFGQFGHEPTVRLGVGWTAGRLAPTWTTSLIRCSLMRSRRLMT